jgi:hypothetical protein
VGDLSADRSKGVCLFAMPKGPSRRLFDLDSRNRRQPRDLVNAILSFVYDGDHISRFTRTLTLFAFGLDIAALRFQKFLGRKKTIGRFP